MKVSIFGGFPGGCPTNNQRFRKGVGGQRGLAQGIPPIPQIQAFFLRHFLLNFGRCWSPTPSCQPLFETSETKQPPQSSAEGISFVRVRFGGFRVRLRRLSEYGSVAGSVERQTWETQAEQYSDTVLRSLLLAVRLGETESSYRLRKKKSFI